MLGASTVAHTSRDSPSVTALPPDEGVEMADEDSAQDEQSMSRHRASIHTGTPSEDDRSSPLTPNRGDMIITKTLPVSVRHPTRWRLMYMT